MTNRVVRAALLCGLWATCASAASAPELEHEFRYESGRFSLTQRGAYREVRVFGAGREPVPGAPDLPVVSETVEVPGSARVVGVEVVEIETAPMASGIVMVPSAGAAPGLPLRHGDPDPKWYGRSGFQPETPVSVGYQGWMRGANLAFLKVVPVRWDAASGSLERIVRLKVRLILEGEVAAPLTRGRLAPAWDGDPVSAALRRRAAPEHRFWSGAAPTDDEGGAVGPTAPPVDASFEATQIPSLLGSPVAYVIITNETMAPEFQRLADWKTQSGVPAVVRTLSFIRSQYPGGVDDADRMRMFIRDAYQRWGATWILLGGDTEVLPTRYVRSEFYGGENIACDMYYSCLDGNWNWDGDHLFGEGYVPLGAPGDSADLTPEVWVGRAPTTTLAEAKQFVDRSLQYVKTPAGNYEHMVLFFAEVLFPQPWTGGETYLDGAEISEDCLPFLQTNPAIHYGRLYQNYTDIRWQPGALPESRAIVIDSLNAGYNVASHIGHGYRNVMSCGDANLTNEDALALSNGNRLTNLYASNCTSNAIDFPSIGEAFLKAPNGGAVTNVGSSRFDFPAAGRYYEEEYFKLVYDDSVTAVGEAQGRQKLPFLSSCVTDGMNRWTVTTLLLLGDPELRIYTGKPRILSVTHPMSLTLAASTIPVTVTIGGSPLAGARVVAYKANDEYRIGTTNASGQVTLPFRPDSVGSCVLTVVGFDCKPFQATIPVTADATPALDDLPFTVIDNGSGGTMGNSSGTADAGEIVNVSITVRNNGGGPSNGVVGTLSTTDPRVTVTTAVQNYGNIVAGASVTAPPFKLSIQATTPDQTEVVLTLTLVDSAPRTWVESIPFTVAAPSLRHDRRVIVDLGGDADGQADPGETVQYQTSLRNMGSGAANALTAVLRNHDGFATVTDSTSSWGTLAAGTEAYGDNFVFVPTNANAKLVLRVSDVYGLRWSKTIDLVPPDVPTGLGGTGSPSSVKLTWTKSAAPDLIGYNVYRSNSPGGPFTRLNLIPTDRTAYYLDSGLTPLTQFHYRISAVDSSGNESNQSTTGQVSTNPPNHAQFPIPMTEGSIASVAIDHIYPGYPLDLVTASNFVYLWHPNGTAPLDADGQGATSGDFSIRGGGYDSAPGIADLDDDGVADIVAISSDSTRAFAFGTNGMAKPGWPVAISHPVWSSPAIGDLDNDGTMEVVFSSNGNKLYAFRSNGTEWIDGDACPGSVGVFKLFTTGNTKPRQTPCTSPAMDGYATPVNYNFSSPGLADLNGNGQLDIVVVDFLSRVHAMRPDTTYLPGFPVDLPGATTASVAIGYLDGVGDTQYDIVVATGDLGSNAGGDSVHVLLATGARRPGWPRYVKLGGNNKAPSPALADMDGDGKLDVVVASTNGKIYVFDRNGVVLPAFNGVAYSALTSAASESSPIVADINGDLLNDILMGDELGSLAAISGTGVMLPGFPISLEAEVKGAPAVCDCDGDGKTEIVIAGYDRHLYMWDYDYPFSPAGAPPWPQFNHDARHTNLASSPAFVDTEPLPPPLAPSLAPPSPNPARSVAALAWAVPADRNGKQLEVAIFDIAGRQVRLIERGPARTGRRLVTWDLRDGTGLSVPNGVYFAQLTIGAERLTRKVAVLR